MSRHLRKILVIMESSTTIKHAVKYADTRGGMRREWTVPCEVIKETKGGSIKVREFRNGGDLIKYVPKSKLIEL